MNIIILGAGQVGSSVAENLSSEANDITLIDTDTVVPKSIRRRLEAIDGTATFQSTDEFGTEVELTMPKEV